MRRATATEDRLRHELCEARQELAAVRRESQHLCEGERDQALYAAPTRRGYLDNQGTSAHHQLQVAGYRSPARNQGRSWNEDDSVQNPADLHGESAYREVEWFTSAQNPRKILNEFEDWERGEWKRFHARSGPRPCTFLSTIPQKKLLTHLRNRLYSREDGYRPAYEDFSDADARALYSRSLCEPTAVRVTDTLAKVSWSTSNNLHAATVDLICNVYDAVTDEMQFTDYFDQDDAGRQRDMTVFIEYVTENLIGNRLLYNAVKAVTANEWGPHCHQWQRFTRLLDKEAQRLAPTVENSGENLRKDYLHNRGTRKRRLSANPAFEGPDQPSHFNPPFLYTQFPRDKLKEGLKLDNNNPLSQKAWWNLLRKPDNAPFCILGKACGRQCHFFVDCPRYDEVGSWAKREWSDWVDKHISRCETYWDRQSGRKNNVAGHKRLRGGRGRGTSHDPKMEA